VKSLASSPGEFTTGAGFTELTAPTACDTANSNVSPETSEAFERALMFVSVRRSVACAPTASTVGATVKLGVIALFGLSAPTCADSASDAMRRQPNWRCSFMEPSQP
jgi:hypothetical protein